MLPRPHSGSYTPSPAPPSLTPSQPSSTSADGCGFNNNNNSRARWEPPGENTHQYRQHLFMNGRTIAHPPRQLQLTWGKAGTRSGNKKIKKSSRNKESAGGLKAARGTQAKHSCDWKCVLWFCLSHSRDRRSGNKTIIDGTKPEVVINLHLQMTVTK